MLAVVFRRTSLASAMSRVTPRGTALKSRFCAEARRTSRSRPPRAAICRAASSVAQAPTWSWGSPSPGNENCSPDQEDCTTVHGYPAECVVWMRMAPAAPWRAAVSYL